MKLQICFIYFQNTKRKNPGCENEMVLGHLQSYFAESRHKKSHKYSSLFFWVNSALKKINLKNSTNAANFNKREHHSLAISTGINMAIFNVYRQKSKIATQDNIDKQFLTMGRRKMWLGKTVQYYIVTQPLHSECQYLFLHRLKYRQTIQVTSIINSIFASPQN